MKKTTAHHAKKATSHHASMKKAMMHHEKAIDAHHKAAEHHKEAHKWIGEAIKHPGALRKELDVKKGHKIPEKKLEAAAKKPGVEGRRARLAETLRGMKK